MIEPLIYKMVQSEKKLEENFESDGKTYLVKKAEAHHDDYNKPLAVRWLCKRCHTDWHLNNKPKYVEGI